MLFYKTENDNTLIKYSMTTSEMKYQ